MVYLDYAANTPVDEDVLAYFCSIYREFIANPNATHETGKAANNRIIEITERLHNLFQKDVIFTSGASEANNLAIKGIVEAYRNNGKHIITSCLEHSSVSGCLTYLQNLGYEIDLVDIKADGTVDMEHLKELIRQDTVLVSICYVEGELGIEQPIAQIASLVKTYPNCFFHTDATQAVGKTKVNFENVDLITFAPHKFYGLNGCGVLLKAKDITLIPLIHGGNSTTIYRSGTPDIASIAALEMALNKALEQLESRFDYARKLNSKLRSTLEKYSLVRINSPLNANPFFLNLSVKGVKATAFKEGLEEYGICISIKSACSTGNTPSRPVYAVTKDKKNAMCSWRVSLSHLTTDEEIEKFLMAFQKTYEKLT